MSKPQMLLWLSDARGVYIPRDFALSFADRAKSVTGVDQETWETLERGPTDEWYWEAWESVLGYARIHDPKWGEYRVYQDGDCWLIPNGMDYDEETDSFVWPDEEAERKEAESQIADELSEANQR